MKSWKIGSLTAGVVLLGIGGLWLLGNLLNFSVFPILKFMWPVVIILFGIEILLYQYFHKESSMRFDGFSIFIIIAVIALFSSSFNMLPSFMANSITQQTFTYDINEEYEINSSIETIVVDMTNADISIHGQTDISFQAVGSLEIGGNDQKAADKIFKDVVKFRTEGDTAFFEIIKPKHLTYQRFKAEIDIALPADRLVDLRLVNGDIEAANLHDGLLVHSVNSDIELNKIENDVDVVVINGSIDGKGIIGSVTAKTTNGEIDLSQVEGHIQASIVNGEVDLADVNITDDSRISTVNGDISLTLNNKENFKIIADTSNGEVEGNVTWERSGDKDDFGYKKHGTLNLGNNEFILNLKAGNGKVIVNK
ncbi:hypothetical protein EJF36_09800 [Bacillus sp. HMF5848]|uniref:DUF4097 family beta strand repeat-containing protein n=1 Tax=Bacillus sp. HMF5848 TaxID=2495421 RepID=UPI000F76D6A9|nr:DUF4097 family beta strand repeat-containing protein [Bacillus sp. HMF5848]RSK27148.1 hypothetical protein EJF36_09800 [Bacillus sp. HMF5848]